MNTQKPTWRFDDEREWLDTLKSFGVKFDEGAALALYWGDPMTLFAAMVELEMIENTTTETDGALWKWQMVDKEGRVHVEEEGAPGKVFDAWWTWRQDPHFDEFDDDLWINGRRVVEDAYRFMLRIAHYGVTETVEAFLVKA